MPRYVEPEPEQTWAELAIAGGKLLLAFSPIILMALCFLGAFEGSEKEAKKRNRKTDFQHAGHAAHTRAPHGPAGGAPWAGSRHTRQVSLCGDSARAGLTTF